MTALPLLLVSTFLAAAPTPPEAPPSPEQVRAAVEKSLPFLQKSSAAWRQERKCVTCHQVPFTVWSLNEAKVRGLAVDQEKLDDLTNWSLDFCTTDKNKGEFT